MTSFDYKARIALAPGRGVSYQYVDDEGPAGIMVINFDGTNPMLVLASMKAWLADVEEAIKVYRAKWRDQLPAQGPETTTIEVDEEVAGFLKLKEKEDITPNKALRYLLFQENPYLDEEQREDLARAEEAHAQRSLAPPDSL